MVKIVMVTKRRRHTMPFSSRTRITCEADVRLCGRRRRHGGSAEVGALLLSLGDWSLAAAFQHSVPLLTAPQTDMVEFTVAASGARIDIVVVAHQSSIVR